MVRTKLIISMFLLVGVLFSCKETGATGEGRDRFPSTTMENFRLNIIQNGERAIYVETDTTTQWAADNLSAMVGVRFYEYTSIHETKGVANRGVYREDLDIFELHEDVFISSETSGVSYKGNSFLFKVSEDIMEAYPHDTVSLQISGLLELEGKGFSGSSDASTFTYANGADGVFYSSDGERFRVTADNFTRTRTDVGATILLEGNATIVGDELTIQSEAITLEGQGPILTTSTPTTVLMERSTGATNLSTEHLYYNGKDQVLIVDGWSETRFSQDDLFIEASYMKSDLKSNIMSYQVGSHLIAPERGIETFADSTVLNLGSSLIELQGSIHIRENENEYNAEQAFINLETSSITLWSSGGSIAVGE